MTSSTDNQDEFLTIVCDRTEDNIELDFLEYFYCNFVNNTVAFNFQFYLVL